MNFKSIYYDLNRRMTFFDFSKVEYDEMGYGDYHRHWIHNTIKDECRDWCKKNLDGDYGFAGAMCTVRPILGPWCACHGVYLFVCNEEDHCKVILWL